MRTVLTAMVLLTLSLTLISTINRDRSRDDMTDTAISDLADNFTAFRAAVIYFVSAMDGQERTGFVTGPDSSATARQIPLDLMGAYLPEGYVMPVMESGKNAWEAWLAWYDGSTRDQAEGGNTGDLQQQIRQEANDYFGGAHNAHIVLYILSRRGKDELALATTVAKALDWPKGVGIACTDTTHNAEACKGATYSGLGIPVVAFGGSPQFVDGYAISSTIFERAMDARDSYSTYKPDVSVSTTGGE